MNYEKCISDALTKFYQADAPLDIQKIGYTEDSHVYSFSVLNVSLVAKLCLDTFEREALDILYEQYHKEFAFRTRSEYSSGKSEKRFLNTALKGLCAPFERIRVVVVTTTCYIYIFKRCDMGNFTMISLEQVKEYVDLGEDLVEAVQNLHRIGYAHCDLKPLNVCMDRGRVCLIDFGTAMKLTPNQASFIPMNTMAFSTPYQFCVAAMMRKAESMLMKNHSFTCEIFNKKLLELVKLKANKGEDPIQNDMFGCGLLLAYILSDKHNFWLGEFSIESMSRKEMYCIFLTSMIMFMKDRVGVIDEFIRKYNMDPDNHNVWCMKTLLCSYSV